MASVTIVLFPNDAGDEQQHSPKKYGENLIRVIKI